VGGEEETNGRMVRRVVSRGGGKGRWGGGDSGVSTGRRGGLGEGGGVGMVVGIGGDGRTGRGVSKEIASPFWISGY